MPAYQAGQINRPECILSVLAERYHFPGSLWIENSCKVLHPHTELFGFEEKEAELLGEKQAGPRGLCKLPDTAVSRWTFIAERADVTEKDKPPTARGLGNICALSFSTSQAFYTAP